MADLETIAVTTASLICFYYGILGITIICTSDCSAETMKVGDEAVKLSPLMATLYCVLAIGAGAVLWKLRGAMRHLSIDANLKTFASVAGHATTQGAAWNALATRYAIISLGLFLPVILWTKIKLLGQLQDPSACKDLPTAQVGTFMWTVRSWMESWEWIIYVVLGLFLLGFLFAFSERNKFEQAASQLGYGAQPGTGAGQVANTLFGGGTPTYGAFNQGGAGGGVPLEHLRALGKTEAVQAQEALQQQALHHQRQLQEQAAAMHRHYAGEGGAGGAPAHPAGTVYVQTPAGLVAYHGVHGGAAHPGGVIMHGTPPPSPSAPPSPHGLTSAQAATAFGHFST